MTVMQIHWNICHICGSIGLNIRQKIETEEKDTCRNNVQMAQGWKMGTNSGSQQLL